MLRKGSFTWNSKFTQGAKGPVNVVLSENWAVYSYYSTANARHEVAVLEFYDASLRSLSIPSLLFGTQNNTLSSFSPVPIEAGPISLSNSGYLR